MNKYPISRFLANKWLWVVLFVFMALCLTFVISLINPGGFSILPALIFAAVVSVFITHITLRLIWFIIVRSNGGPFRNGDTVQILVGPHQGRIVRIYEEWRERNQVKVELGEEAKKTLEDVFSYIELKNTSAQNN